MRTAVLSLLRLAAVGGMVLSAWLFMLSLANCVYPDDGFPNGWFIFSASDYSSTAPRGANTSPPGGSDTIQKWRRQTRLSLNDLLYPAVWFGVAGILWVVADQALVRSRRDNAGPSEPRPSGSGPAPPAP